MARQFVAASNQRIEFAALSDYTTKLSFSVWVNPDSAPISGVTFYTIFSKAKDGNDRNIDIDYRGRSGVLHVEVDWTQPTSTFQEWVVSTGHTLNVGVWHNLVYAIDWTTNPDSVQLWINGVAQSMSSVGSSNNATPTTGSPALNRIGSLIDAPGAGWDGRIAELAVWPDVLLTDGEAIALGRGFAPFVVHPTGLETYPQLIREITDYKGIVLTNQGTTPGSHPPMIYAG